MNEREELRSEDAAVQTTITLKGWACKKCGNFFRDDAQGGGGERCARYCCATSFPCDCGGRYEKPYAACPACRGKAEHERWLKLKRVEWDEETPLCLFRSDTYFWNPDGLGDWLEENELDLDDVMLVVCEPNYGRPFELVDVLCDALPDDGWSLPESGRKLEAHVNAWLKENGPYSWREGETVPSIESLKGAVDEKPQELCNASTTQEETEKAQAQDQG